METELLDLGRRLDDGAGFTLDPDHLTSRLHCLQQNRRGQARATADVCDTHSRGQSSPVRLCQDRFRIRLAFQALNLLRIFHQVFEKISSHNFEMLAVVCLESNGIEVKQSDLA